MNDKASSSRRGDELRKTQRLAKTADGITQRYSAFERWRSHADQLGYAIASQRGDSATSRWVATNGNRFVGFFSRQLKRGELEVPESKVGSLS